MDTRFGKRTLWISVAVVAAAGLAAGAYFSNRGSAGAEISTVTLTRGDVVVAVGATGTLETVTSVQVGSQVSGTIQELFADFNSIVRKGQLLAKLNSSSSAQAVEEARAAVVKAEADLELLRVSRDAAEQTAARYRVLASRQLLAAADLEMAETALRLAESQVTSATAKSQQVRAALNQAQVTLQKSDVTSPIDGIVVSRDVDVGQTVAASMQAPTLFVIAADLSRLRLNASVDESDVGQVRAGQAVRFRVDAFPSDEFTGTVSQVRLAATVEQNVVSYDTIIDVPNAELKLRPGMTANVMIEVARRDDVLRVANAALRFRPSEEAFAALGQPVPELGAGAAPASRTGASVVFAANPVMATAKSNPTTDTAGSPVSRLTPATSGPGGAAATFASAGRLWMLAGGRLTPIDVFLGLNDGTVTEVRGAAVSLEEGIEVVTGVQTTERSTTRTTAPSNNPFLGTMPAGRPPGMRPGG